MKQIFRAKALVLLCALISIAAIISAQNVNPAFFDATTLTKIMSQRDCAGVRFYNVILPSSNKMSTMAIGIRADESEIFNLSNRYYVFTSATASGLEYDKLSQRKAAEASLKVKDNGANSFSASFTKSDLRDMLQSASMLQSGPVLESVPVSGIIIQQKNLASKTLFEAQAGVQSAGSFAPIQNAAARMSGEPCPTFCGNSQNYVHMQ